MNYPEVRDEWETLHTLLERRCSIARFGDGEFKMVDGKEYVREPRNFALTDELQQVLWEPTPDLLVGIPTMNPIGPKYATGWEPRLKRFTRLLEPSNIEQFYSAFISRPDSAPWINDMHFARQFEQLWAGKSVALVCEKGSSAYRVIKLAAKSLTSIRCPSHNAYAQIDEFESQIEEARPDVTFLSCGVAATCLAARLARKGIPTIDFGSGGGFLNKLLNR